MKNSGNDDHSDPQPEKGMRNRHNATGTLNYFGD